MKLKNVGFLGKENEIYLCVSKKSKYEDLVLEILNTSLEKMQKNGTIDRLKRKYSIK
jgi:ABC-type amino acid transport substrate-binding protein